MHEQGYPWGSPSTSISSPLQPPSLNKARPGLLVHVGPAFSFHRKDSMDTTALYSLQSHLTVLTPFKHHTDL